MAASFGNSRRAGGSAAGGTISRQRSLLPSAIAGERFHGSGEDDGRPMLELNTTPLIDVMLVLLVMLIITIPSQTHQVALDLPGTPPVVRAQLNPLRNMLTIAPAGVTRWNGQAVNDRTLAGLFGDVAAMERPAEVHFRPDPAARYERVDEVLAIASRSGVKTLGFVGNERYRDSF